MKSHMFHIVDEISPLEEVFLAKAKYAPQEHNISTTGGGFDTFKGVDDKWNLPMLNQQLEQFAAVLEKYRVLVQFADPIPGSPYQIFTRDVGFVYDNTFYFNRNRRLDGRKNEYEAIATHFYHGEQCVEIKSGKLEGGDVLVDKDVVFIGISDRTTIDAVTELEAAGLPVKPLYLGPKVMHLDTRMNILPNRYLLIYQETFASHPEDLDYLRRRFEFIEVTEEEAKSLATNVLVVDLDTIIMDERQERIIKLLQDRRFNVETMNYSEPQRAFSGSFHCTTLPLRRKKQLHRGVDFEKHAYRAF